MVTADGRPTILNASSAPEALKVIFMSFGVQSAGPEVMRRLSAVGQQAASAAGSAAAATVISLVSDVLQLLIPFQAIATVTAHGGAIRAQDRHVRYAELLLLKPAVDYARDFRKLPPIGSLRLAPSAMYPFGHTLLETEEVMIGNFFREQNLEAGAIETDNPLYELQLACFMAAADDDDRKLRDTHFTPSLHRFGGVRARVYERNMNRTCGEIRAEAEARGVTLRRVYA